MSNIDIWEIKKEWVFFLRNQDIFTTTQRDVTTATETGTFAADDEFIINRTNVKNIRSVTVDGNVLSYGIDYNVDIDYLDTTIKCRITFTTDQTGDYTIVYDYGSDKIFPDFPRDDLTLSSFPRIGADVISTTSELLDMDGTLVTAVSITTIVYTERLKDLANYITDISTSLQANKRNFYYIGKFVYKISVGPILKIPEEISLDKIFQQNIDIRGILNFER